MGAGTVVIGTGQAGFQTAASLREQGYQEPITLIGEEPYIPYHRPPLSKGFQVGQQDFESIELRPGKFYQNHRIELVLAQRVAAIDRATKRVTLGSGAQIPYEKLVLAVGARNRVLPIRGAELDGVLSLRTLDEAVVLKERLANAREIVVIGGGFIGLEVASVACTMAKQVTVLEALPRLMSRAVAPVVSEFYEKLHTSKGVKVICGATVSEIAGASGCVQKVLLAGGAAFAADLVLVGIGVAPNVELAREAGLRVTNGIAVNEFLQTDDPDILAIGDCAEHPCVFAGARVRLESVQNAAEQAQCAAATIAGRRDPYRALPWFWTDQYDVKLQMAGISLGHDQIVMRGKPESLKFSVFYFRAGRLAAIDSINRPVDHMMGRRLIAAGIPVSLEEAADESVDLKLLAHRGAQHAVHPPA